MKKKKKEKKIDQQHTPTTQQIHFWSGALIYLREVFRRENWWWLKWKPFAFRDNAKRSREARSENRAK